MHYKTIDSYYKNKIKRYEAYSTLNMCVALNGQVGNIIKIVEIQ